MIILGDVTEYLTIENLTESLRSNLFRFPSGKRESREGSGDRGDKKLVALAPYVRATSPWLSLSPRAKRKRKRLLRRLTDTANDLSKGLSNIQLLDSIANESIVVPVSITLQCTNNFTLELV